MTDQPVTPEDVAATAQDEADAPVYDITPAPDPDLGEEATSPEELPEFDQAFLVITRHDGTSFATADLGTQLSTARPADLGSMFRACTEVLSDIETTKVSQNIMAMLVQQGQAAAEAAEQERIRSALAKKGIDVAGVHRRR